MLQVSLPRPLNKLAQAAVVVFVTLFVFIGLTHYRGTSPFSSNAIPSEDLFREPLKDGNATLLALAPPYIEAIMNPKDEAFPRLQCRPINAARYGYLARDSTGFTPSDQKYFFALDLHECAKLLPRLLGSIVETMNFLGPERCSLSIVEGNSEDGTFEILKLLREAVERMGATYHFVSSELDTSKGDRIDTLAQLRNLALRPVISSRSLSNTTVVFLNDVAICAEDILELIHQRDVQKADMTCGLDWTYVGQDPTFYDVWIARGMTGDTFFEIPEDGNWNSAWNLFWNDPTSRDRLNAHQPFQVFACWNGATAFTGKALRKIQFRRSNEKECYQGEPKLFCKDMWHQGFGKIAVVPTVNIEYSDEAAQKIKALKGHVSDWVDKEDGGYRIQWALKPPEKVKCMRNYNDQIWVPWDENL